ncbi:MAG: hypothetical protein JO075_14270, partial [Acidimicrobiia bacterium]|nr:hypothetical protein [Acidimicrobiia bacterium]
TPGGPGDPAYFRAISTDYHHFVQAFAEQRHVEIVQPPKDIRREDWASHSINAGSLVRGG